MSYFNLKLTCHYLSEWDATSQNVVLLKRKKNRMHIEKTVTSLFKRYYIFFFTRLEDTKLNFYFDYLYQ